MSNKKIHGERNKDLSLQLLQQKVYFDWVVTTSFYSSIHFVEDKLLPCQINGQTCSNINEVKKAYNLKGRHESRQRLVTEHMTPSNAAKYKWLDDRSRFSRYTTYKVTSAEAEKAKEFLQAIHKECYPPQ